VSRFSEAISEGDGISVIPVLEGDIGELAVIAEQAGAEALAVRTPAEAERARARTSLPIVVRAGDPAAAAGSGADACILVFEELAGDGDRLESAYARVREVGLDCAVDVRDEEELEAALARIDPDLVILSERDPEKGEEQLERTLDLLPDVPAGKLVISESAVVAREQVVALERAGVDAVLIRGLASAGDFAATLGELVSGSSSYS
jgi:indole-3-glycerol phosphate synthase